MPSRHQKFGQLATAKVNLHNKILKQICPSMEDSTTTVQLFRERDRTRTVLCLGSISKFFLDLLQIAQLSD